MYAIDTDAPAAALEGAVDLRSDTVTRPTAGHAPGDGRGRGGRRRLPGGPDAPGARGARRGAVRPRGRAVRAVGDDGQPDRPAAGLPARRGDPRRRRLPRAHLRAGRGRGDLRAVQPHGGQRRRAAGRRPAHRAGPPARGLARDPDRGDRRGEHAQPGRRARPAARRAAEAVGLVAGGRASPSTSTARGSSTPPSPPARTSPPSAGSPTPRRSACPRAWGRRSARCWWPRPSGSPPPGCGASGWAAACARPASWPPPACTRSTTTSSGWPTTTTTPGCWPSGSGSTRRRSRRTSWSSTA